MLVLSFTPSRMEIMAFVISNESVASCCVFPVKAPAKTKTAISNPLRTRCFITAPYKLSRSFDSCHCVCIAKMDELSISLTQPEAMCRCSPLRSNLLFDPIAGPCVGGEHHIKTRRRLRSMRFTRGADQSRDFTESDFFAEECRDRDFIRRIQHRRHRAAGSERAIGEPDTRESLVVRREEFELPKRRQIERGKLRFAPGWVG